MQMNDLKYGCGTVCTVNDNVGFEFVCQLSDLVSSLLEGKHTLR